MNNNYLKAVKTRLEELRNDLYIAEKTKDKRSREKRIREAKLAISDFANTFPNELQGTLNVRVGGNSLSYKWVEGDINRCIEVIQEMIEEAPEEES